MLAGLLYLGFYRSGCVCPIGAIQNVAHSLTDSTYTISIVITLIFLLPIVAALLFGRLFCGGVCPFGVVQEILARWSLRIPRWIDKPLRCVRWAYLLTALYFVVGGFGFFGLFDGAVTRDYIICRFDPFVSMFRAIDMRSAMAGDFANTFQLTAAGWVWWLTGGVLLLSVFIRRPYCRWLCPYGAILGACSRAAKKTVTTMPEECCECELCSKACTYGAIENHAAVAHLCVACGRCYLSCPLQRQWLGIPVTEPSLVPEPVPPAPLARPQRGPVTWPRIIGEQETLDLDYIETLIAHYGRDDAAALPMLQQIQARHRYLPRPALERVVASTDLTMGKLLSIATFYNQFRMAPIGEHLICVCHGTACHVAGARRITDAIRLHLGIEGDADTDAERRFTVEHVACLGCCSLAPCMQIDGVTFGHLTGETARMAVESVAAGRITPEAAAPLGAPPVCHDEPIAVGKEAER